MTHRRLKVTVRGPNPRTVTVADAATGELLKAVAVDLRVDMKGTPRLTVTVVDFDAEVEADAVIIKGE